ESSCRRAADPAPGGRRRKFRGRIASRGGLRRPGAGAEDGSRHRPGGHRSGPSPGPRRGPTSMGRNAAGPGLAPRRLVVASVNLKNRVGKLNPTCRRALEAGAGLCLSRTNYNVEVEHWLLKLLEPADTDLARVLKHYGVDPGKVTRDLTRALDGLRTGN